MIRGKTLAVIGASYLQLPLIEKARELGVRTICFAWEDGAVCRDAADRFYPVSILEKEEILDICRREQIDGITSIASDAAVPTVLFVADALGLPGNSIASGECSTNKFAMRRALREAGVNCPDFHRFHTPEEAQKAAEKLGFPVIVKPCDRSGSLGVTRVCGTDGLAEAAQNALDVSFSRTGIVETCIDFRQEISVEGISYQGRYHLLAMTGKVTTGAPHYVELGHHQPAEMSKEIFEKVFQQVQLGVKALQITCGASHAELMITGNGQVFITEIGARMGGDFIGSDLVRLSTGYDFLQGVIECALGDFSGVTITENNAAGIWFYSTFTPGVAAILRNLAAHSYIIRGEYDTNAVLSPLVRSADRSGFLIYRTAPDAEELHRLRDISFVS